MDLAVSHTEAPLDRLAHPLERPQLRAEAAGLRPGQQEAAQLVVLLGIELGGTAALAHDAQAVQAVGDEHIQPAVHGLPRRTHRRSDLGRRLSSNVRPHRKQQCVASNLGCGLSPAT